MRLSPFVGLRVTDDLPRQSLRYHADCRQKTNQLCVMIAHGSVLLSGELFRSLYSPTGHFWAIWPKVFQKNLPMPENIGRV